MNVAIKTAIILGIIAAGIYAVANMEDTIKSTFVEVPVVTLSREAYRSTVTAAGSVFSDGKNWYAEVYADESDVPALSAGQEVSVKGAAFSGGISGEIVKISDTAEKINGRTVVALRILLDAAEKELKNGFTADATIYTDEAEILNVLPYETIMQDDKSEYVYIYEDNKAKRRDIKTGIELSDCAEITEGLTPDTKVIAYPGEVSENDFIKVKVRDD